MCVFVKSFQKLCSMTQVSKVNTLFYLITILKVKETFKMLFHNAFKY